MNGKKKVHLSFKSENVAVPDVLVEEEDENGKVTSYEQEEEEEEVSGIQFDTLAVPEIHFKH